MGEAKKRRDRIASGLPTLTAIPAKSLMEYADASKYERNRTFGLPKPEHEKWGPELNFGKTLIVTDANGNSISPKVVAEKMREAGKHEAEIAEVMSRMNRPWPSADLNAVPGWYPDEAADVKPGIYGADPFPPGYADDFKRRLMADEETFRKEFMNSFPYVAEEPEPYDPVEVAKPYLRQRSFGRKNVYQCDNAHATVTVDAAEGVTPFMIVCPDCQEYARSKMYRVDQSLDATHEWYRPETLDGISPHSHDHVKRGGLIMRKIGDNEPQQATEH